MRLLVLGGTAFVGRAIIEDALAGAMDALGDRTGRYLFISSHAVYEPGGGAGPYNAVGPSTTMSDLIHTCAEAAGTAV